MEINYSSVMLYECLFLGGMERKVNRVGENRVAALLQKGGGIHLELIDEMDKHRHISLNLNKMAELIASVSSIDDAVAKLRRRQQVNERIHRGGNVHISISQGIFCVDFRVFWLDLKSGQLKPSKKVIALRLGEWECFKRALTELTQYAPELLTIERCSNRGIHSCFECNPDNL